MTLGEVVDSAEDAATADLRGDKMLPWALKIIGTPREPDLANAVAKLREWAGTGSHRLDKDRDGHYDQTDAVRLMDAWDKTMPAAVFKPKMGDALFKRYDEHLSPDLPNSFHGDGHDHLGSAWEVGWFGPLTRTCGRWCGRRRSAASGT